MRKILYQTYTSILSNLSDCISLEFKQ